MSQTHEQYIEEMKALDLEMRDALGELKTLELTPEEQKVISALPTSKHRLIESVLSRYQAGPVDLRRDMVYKALAVMMMKTKPVLSKAWKLGTESAKSFGVVNGQNP